MSTASTRSAAAKTYNLVKVRLRAAPFRWAAAWRGCVQKTGARRVVVGSRMWRLDTTATATRGYRRFAVGTRPECTVFGKRVVGRKAAGKRGAVAVVGSAESQARVHLDQGMTSTKNG